MQSNKIIHIIVWLTICGLLIFSCKTNSKTTEATDKTVNINNLTVGPIVHDTLKPDQIEKIKKIQTTFEEVNPASLEETINDFKRDANPDNEITIWLVMAAAYERFALKNKALDINKRKEAYKLILMRSMVDEAEAKAKSNLQVLTNKEVAEIFSYYNLAAKQITFEKK